MYKVYNLVIVASRKLKGNITSNIIVQHKSALSYRDCKVQHGVSVEL